MKRVWVTAMLVAGMMAAAGGALAQRPSMPVGVVVGVGVPGALACTPGQRYFQTDAIPGRNDYICTASGGVNTYSLSSASVERFSWALCLGVNCQIANTIGNAVLVTRSVTISACYAKAKTAPTGTDLRIVINRIGTTNIFTTFLSIPVGDTAVQTNTAIAAAGALTAGQYLTLDITQVGSTEPGMDVSVTCVGN